MVALGIVKRRLLHRLGSLEELEERLREESLRFEDVRTQEDAVLFDEQQKSKELAIVQAQIGEVKRTLSFIDQETA